LEVSPDSQGDLAGSYVKFTTDEVCERLEANDVPFARINSRDQVVTDPQIEAMGALIEFEHHQGGPMRQPRPQGQFLGTPAGLHRSSPGLGEHTDEILGECGLSAAEIQGLRDSNVIV
jgi:crotonobetainyl-CoA:carnitine CoA-transferase CaiB-like acyl-CoA transferase